MYYTALRSMGYSRIRSLTMAIRAKWFFYQLAKATDTARINSIEA